MLAGEGRLGPPAGRARCAQVLLDSSVVKTKTATRVGNTVTVTIDGYDGHTCQLQGSSDLAGTNFGGASAVQNGVTVLTFTDSSASGAKGFYRVIVDP